MDLENIRVIWVIWKIIQVQKYIYILQKYYKSVNIDLEILQVIWK